MIARTVRLEQGCNIYIYIYILEKLADNRGMKQDAGWQVSYSVCM